MNLLRIVKGCIARLAGAPLMPAMPAMPAPTASRTVRSARRFGAVPPAAARADNRTTRRRHGDEAEIYARRYLECVGLTFVAANVLYRDGEIDLVMRDARPPWASPPLYVFVEVRRRSRDGHGGAAASITRDKRRRIAAAAAHYLVGLGLRTLPACRFDVVAVDGDPVNGFHVDWIRDAFQDEG